MGYFLSQYCQVFAVIAVAALSGCHAFVPSPNAFVVFQSPGFVESNAFRAISSFPKQSRLSMVIDQFVAGRDEKTRKKETEIYLAEVQKRVDRVNELEATFEDLDDDELRAKTNEFKVRLAKGEDINGPILEEAFAVVREAAW